jgi:DNA-3-methyladenine glycosylase I
MKKRCPWADGDPLLAHYHDTEWGVPMQDEQGLFEYLVLDGMQAGLSWLTILKKRDAFRAAFSDFDPGKVARYGDRQVARLMHDAGIVRNRLKIEAAIGNARAFLAVQKQEGSFREYIWGLARPIPGAPGWTDARRIPAHTPQSVAMSKALQKRGFRFVGPTICYAFMQAAGMVNDHLASCFRMRETEGLRRSLLE